MSHCVNCDKSFTRIEALCPVCRSDQKVPNEFMEFQLQQNRSNPVSRHDPAFGYPGEKTALLFSIAIVLLIAIVLGTLSLGLFLTVLIINIIAIKMSHISTQKNMIRATEYHFKDIYRLSKIAAFRLKIALPEVYIMQEPVYNAYTTGIYRYGFIVINSSMVDTFAAEEMLFVLGHEMGHMKRYHTTWMNLLYPARVGGIKFFFAPVVQYIFNIWTIKAEYTADQAGLIACRDLKPAMLCLLKLSGGPNVAHEVDIAQVMNSADQYENILNGIVEYFGTHPFIENRIKQLIRYSERMKQMS
jgi:Zn-dependent protease with chaperone function